MRQIAELSLFIYRRDLKEILLIIVLIIGVWIIAGLLLSKTGWTAHVWRVLNCIVLFLIVVAILYLTIFSRNATNDREVCLIPFYSLYLAQENPEYYRTMFMNLFLFVPLGLSAPNVFGGHKNPVRRSVLLMIVLSIVTEMLQFFFQLGRAELDDVLCNMLGGIVGAGAYISTRKRERD